MKGWGVQRLRQQWQRIQREPRLDLPLLGGLLALLGVGLLTLLSASDVDRQLVSGQAIRIGLGLLLMLAVSRVPPVMLRNWTPWLYAGSMALLVVLAFLGEGRGANRWLDLGIVRFQPSELLKLTMPMMAAWFLSRRPLPPSWGTLGMVALLIAFPSVLIARQPDLGTALLVGASGIFAIFLSGLSWGRIVGLLAVCMASVPVAWRFLHDYQRTRVRMLLDPDADPLGSGWHIIQSKIAVGSGGTWGKGWGHGTQSRLEFLPEHTTDFVLAVFAEEFGLIGILLLLALYSFVIGRGVWIAAQARYSYSRLLAGSIAMSFSIYVLVNGGMVSGLLPVVGVPLPLISYGGTSAVSLLVGFGLLMSIHAHRKLVARA